MKVPRVIALLLLYLVVAIGALAIRATTLRDELAAEKAARAAAEGDVIALKAEVSARKAAAAETEAALARVLRLGDRAVALADRERARRLQNLETMERWARTLRECEAPKAR